MNFFVTGGSRGIGRALVLDAARAGHDVGFTWVRSEGAAQEVIAEVARVAPQARVRTWQLDVRDSAAVEEVVERFEDELGTVDVAVCNAAVNRDALCMSMTDEAWAEVLDTNLSGSFYVARAVLPGMLAQRFGRVVLMSSIAKDGLEGQANYAASKAGLLGLCGVLCREYASRGITANALVLGFFETDLTRASMPERLRRWWVETCPSGRMGELSEVSDAVLFLASRGASFVNGQALPVTGGLNFAG